MSRTSIMHTPMSKDYNKAIAEKQKQIAEKQKQIDALLKDIKDLQFAVEVAEEDRAAVTDQFYKTHKDEIDSLSKPIHVTYCDSDVTMTADLLSDDVSAERYWSGIRTINYTGSNKVLSELVAVVDGYDFDWGDWSPIFNQIQKLVYKREQIQLKKLEKLATKQDIDIYDIFGDISNEE